MDTLEIKGSTGKSMLLVGETLDHLPGYLPPSPMIVITDDTVHRLYGDRFPDGHIIKIGTGETIKTLDTVTAIFTKLIEYEADRSVFIVGIGGGIVCDIAGFTASTYLRGVRFGFAPTTLLAQVDASVGGKNGVNFSGYKNMVGVFNQPEFVICDPSLLQTLDAQNRGCGLAEVVKHAVVADVDLFAYIENNVEAVMAMTVDAVHRMVYDSVIIKSGIVNRDEKEAGERRKLNFGHTFGHAVEKVGKVPHGEAVSIGMMVAATLSARRGYITAGDVQRLGRLLKALKLPSRLDIGREKAFDAMKRDKKRVGDAIHFVLLERIGRAVVEEIPMAELKDVINEFC
jgi:3-dehydroquinate synthase